MSSAQTNWSGNYRYQAKRLHRPQNVEEVRGLVVACDKVKVVGTRHSFNGIADSVKDHISLSHLNRVVSLDRERRTVTVEGGIRYGDLARYLHREGFALHNMASLPHISVAGAVATATHGSGDANGNLATAVSAMEFVAADGDVVALCREQDAVTFPGAVVSLGGLGVVTKLRLDIVPTFQIRQNLYENLPRAMAEEHLDAIFAGAYSVSLFTDWRNDNFHQVWFKGRVTGGDARQSPPFPSGMTPAAAPLHPIAGIPAENCTQQMGVAGAWHERLPHFRMEFTPSSGEELQSEYFVPRRHARAALAAIFSLGDLLAPLLLVSEVRTVAADDLWMSPCYRQDCVALHFTWKRDWPAVAPLLLRIEESLAPFDICPHWGKLFTMSPVQLYACYEKLDDFQQLIRRYDPHGKFHNAFLETYILE